MTNSHDLKQVTDLKSGLRSAGMEFGYGVGDGITGLVTQPWHGAKEGGAIGLGKGVAKGLGGFLLKPAAGVFFVFHSVSAFVHSI